MKKRDKPYICILIYLSIKMNITSLLRPLFAHRIDAIERYSYATEEIQSAVLKKLIAQSTETEWGKKHSYITLKTYTEYSKLPVQTYEDIKADIDRMRHGEADVLWRGKVKWYAKSSGTTNDKSKFIPVSSDGLKHIHYMGGKDALALYLRSNPKSRIFSGKGLILGGSHSPNFNVKGSLVGDLSAILIENIPSIANLIRVPSKEIALLSDFEEKVRRIAESTIRASVTNLSGVPSWMMSVLKYILEQTGKQDISEVWPMLEVFFHGGVSFTPYREQYKQLIRGKNMHYMETYNASEGFFGLQDDLTDPAMLLMIDYDVFYEFIPLEELEEPEPTVVPLWGVEVGKNYAMLITTSCGLWRYMIGDTVKFTQKDPYKFIITGRTKSFINAFGEELMVDNAEKGLAQACAATGAIINEYTAAPVFMDADGKCRHQWLIEFEKMPVDMALFGKTLDKALQQINSDYEAKRYKDLTLQLPEIIVAPTGLFHRWLKEKGKLGGQHKVPRLCNTRQHIDEMLQLLSH